VGAVRRGNGSGESVYLRDSSQTCDAAIQRIECDVEAEWCVCVFYTELHNYAFRMYKQRSALRKFQWRHLLFQCQLQSAIESASQSSLRSADSNAARNNSETTNQRTCARNVSYCSSFLDRRRMRPSLAARSMISVSNSVATRPSCRQMRDTHRSRCEQPNFSNYSTILCKHSRRPTDDCIQGVRVQPWLSFSASNQQRRGTAPVRQL
jgi:hypothetical protein